MRILSPEKKYLYYLMISQLHEDGYTQQAMQLEVTTIHSSGSVKASDKLCRLFSSCLSSVNEATSFFNHSKSHNSQYTAGRKRFGQSAANIRAANLANLAKRRKTAASLDSTSMLQDSIKKCVKLVTTDLQKATSDISSISPGSSSMIPKQSQKLQKNTASRQLFPSNPPMGGSRGLLQIGPKSKGISPVSNSFLKGINLLKTSKLPTVTPAIPTKSPQSTSVPISAQQILAQQRLSSELTPHPVIRVTKNTSNDPVIIDVEASSSSSSGLQLTQPRSARPQARIPSPGRPQSSLQLVTNPKPVLTVGHSNASALKSLVNRISKRPVLNIPRKAVPKKPLEVVVIDGMGPPTTPTSVYPNIVTSAGPMRKSLAPSLTLPIPTPTPNAYPFDPSSVSLPSSSISPVLSTLGLQPSDKSPYYSTASTTGPVTRGHASTSASTTTTPTWNQQASSEMALTRNQQASSEMALTQNQQASSEMALAQNQPTSSEMALTPTQPTSSETALTPNQPTSSETSPQEPEPKVIKDEDTSSAVSLQIACVQCEDPAEDKYKIPAEEGEGTEPPAPPNNVTSPAEPDKSQDEQTPTKAAANSSGEPPGNVSSDTDFPSQIFAEESPKDSKESEPFKSPTTSVSEMLHAATDALLEQA